MEIFHKGGTPPPPPPPPPPPRPPAPPLPLLACCVVLGFDLIGYFSVGVFGRVLWGGCVVFEIGGGGGPPPPPPPLLESYGIRGEIFFGCFLG